MHERIRDRIIGNMLRVYDNEGPIKMAKYLRRLDVTEQEAQELREEFRRVAEEVQRGRIQ